MVQIFVKLSESSKVEEWSIIELQGDLEIDNGQSLAEKFMGDLHFNKDGTPILILGHHVLFGKVANLEKPMVLIKKVRKLNENINLLNQDDDEEMKSCENDVINNKTKTEYLIQAIIKKKLLFNKRPKPIVF